MATDWDSLEGRELQIAFYEAYDGSRVYHLQSGWWRRKPGERNVTRPDDLNLEHLDWYLQTKWSTNWAWRFDAISGSGRLTVFSSDIDVDGHGFRGDGFHASRRDRGFQDLALARAMGKALEALKEAASGVAE